MNLSALTSFIGDYGLYAVFLLMAVDAVLPAASELVMVYGGAVAAGAFAGQSVSLLGADLPNGFWSFVAIATAGTLGYLVGGIGGWAIGKKGGRGFLERHGKWVHLNAQKLDKAEAWFERHGPKAVFLGRITPVIRSFISIPAGVFGSPLGQYTALTLAGSALWSFPLAGVGWGLGASWERFHHAFSFVDYGLAAIVAGGIVWFGVRTLRNRRKPVGPASSERS
jgi:membrane protein DedA with SNARE-associated domain